MLRNIVPANKDVYIRFRLEFLDDTDSGYAFDCDEEGNPLFSTDPHDAARDNYNFAMQHPEMFPKAFNRFTKHTWHCIEHAHGTCECGTEVELYNQYQGACECPSCGRWYNLFGQEIKNPSAWEDDSI